ncbi:4228_t:CDS:1, partial [Gigaspora rosea]
CKFAEVEALCQQDQADKNQDNQVFSDGLLRERKTNLSENEVE